MAKETISLMPQTAARQEARRINSQSPGSSTIAVAVAWPLGSWGGHEEGWCVQYVLAARFV
jgi:hypothetical protein